MKKTTLALLCCSTLLYACDNEQNANKQAATTPSDSMNSAIESAKDAASHAADAAKQTAGIAMDAAKDVSAKAVAAGKELKEVAVEGTSDAVDAVKQASATAVNKTEQDIASMTGDDSKQGEAVFKKACATCHGMGIAGAPKLGDKAAWSSRIAKGNTVLTKHAIEGFKGETGYMPPKGGFASLSNDEIAAVVNYMVSQAK